MKPPSFWSSAWRIFELSLGEMLWSRRTIFMALLAAGPVAIAAFTRVLATMDLFGPDAPNLRVTGSTLFGLMIWVFYLRFTVPVLGVFYGTALMADEIEDKTLTYLFTRPIPRGAVLVGKYLAYLVCTASVVLPSVVLVFWLVAPIRSTLAESFVPLLRDLALLGLGLAVYGAVFAWVGARLKRPLVTGLVFAIGWEPTALVFPGYMRNLTVAHYLQALVPHAMPQDGPLGMLQAVFRDAPTPGRSLLCLAATWAVFLVLAVRAVERREYVLEQ
jgi:ABC-type transport system involved in multi-copper enzyme maturation permease subunit